MSTPAAALAKALRGLRSLIVRENVHVTALGPAPVRYECLACGRSWERPSDERHTPGCPWGALLNEIADASRPFATGSKDSLETYVRDDRHHIRSTMDGLSDLLTFGDAILVMERYGVSVSFDPDSLAWRAIDPKGAYEGISDTPAGAIFVWDLARTEGDRDEREARSPLRVVRPRPKGNV